MSKEILDAECERCAVDDAHVDHGFIVAAPAGVAFTAVPVVQGQIFSQQATLQTGPSGSVTYYVNGPPGARVRIALKRVANSGGHAHGGEATTQAAVGTVTPSDITLGPVYPQNVVVTHRVTDVCGAITVTASFSAGSPSQIDARTEVRVLGLVPLAGSAHLLFKAPTAEHPSPYNGTPAMSTALNALADAFAAKTGKAITVTDGCLATGGRYDLNLDWQAPHAEHMNGRQADIRNRDMTAADRQVFLTEAARLNFNVLDEGNHFHVRLKAG